MTILSLSCKQWYFHQEMETVCLETHSEAEPSLWQQDSSKNRNLSGMKMNGEGTGIGGPTPAVVGYLGKREDKNGSSGNCPWCLAKGQTNALRFYAVNLEETVLLCTNPVCLYPLVSRPLEDVRASLPTLKDLDGCKRKASSLSVVEDVSSPSKQLREEKLEILSTVSEPCVVDLNECTPPNDTVQNETFMDDQSILEKNTEEQYPEVKTISTDVDLNLWGTKDGCVSSTQDEVKETFGMNVDVKSSAELVPVQPHLFWKNEDNLCWLDSLLVMLVNCKTIRETPCQNVRLTDKLTSAPCSSSAVWNLCSAYDKTCAYLQSKQLQDEDKVTRVPADVLEEAERQLSALRLSFFKLLQPTLKCEIGQQETPVFALPLLLRSDKWAQDLFQHTICWEFKCTACGYTLNDSVEKTLTTFTRILSDWHPLKAIHRTQCSNCNRKNQRRKMVPERLSSVFALHFVEGLPRKDLSRYSFEFQGSQYNVRTIIQFNKNLQHFVTWIHQSNGSWLELDDLKYPRSITHKRLTLPANEIHVVFWEVDSNKDRASEICPLTTPLAVSNVDNNKLLHKLSDSAANDTSVLGTITVNEDKDLAVASTIDASIGNTTLMDAFEGLSHTDIMTLTPATNGTHLQVPKTPAIVPAVLPYLPKASSLSRNSESVCQPSSPPKRQRCSSGSKEESSLVAPKITLPSVGRSSVPTEKHVPLPLASSGSTLAGALSCSTLLQRYASFQSTPVKPHPSAPKPKLKYEGSEALPAKPADLFGGFITKKLPNLPYPGGVVKNPSVVPQQKPINPPGTMCPPGKVSEIFKFSGKKTPKLSVSNQPLGTTEALRLKLMKKLKAKKKKLAKLNELLGNREATPKPDSTAFSSPYSVTSSTSAYSPAYDQFFAELLSPATTVSNLSPDSTGLLEMLNNSQNVDTTNGSEQVNSSAATVVPEPTFQNYAPSTNDSAMALDEYLETWMGQTSTENKDFNALDLFF
ncbi:SUMO-specific isopeptidase USPL1-like isoform X2 [Myxocyprinus asiaticus]|uniref:SUMO-specific isopeptidase USPL1-like isoform X2 n=1 Tax=Myxocyprinus asiaticus TaxID=70543 RepID=UPI002223D140|nr:SUMO-specific isopeptidase USPL1-like isoform X2 [Myxocyprinus asiaticus]